MPIYHFCLATDDEFMFDPEGAFLPNDGIALRAAADVIAEFRSWAETYGSRADWRLEIYEAGGRKVGTLPL